MPQLTHVLTLRGFFARENLNLGAIKSGPIRSITAITHGFIEGVKGTQGEGLKVELIGGGSDWILFDPTTQLSHLDVRTQGKTADGEFFFVHYTGYLKQDEAADKFISWSPDAKTTNYGDHHWWSAPNIETSSKKFKWVETTLFVGQGRWFAEDGQQAVEYRIYAVGN